jgi:hypothetical protein
MMSGLKEVNKSTITKLWRFTGRAAAIVKCISFALKDDGEIKKSA